jgi:drug/metabolite transporter (DMT)-like permease
VTAIAGPHTDPLMLTSLRSAPTALALLAAIPVLRYRLPQTKAAWWWVGTSGLLMVTVFLGGFTEAIIRAGPGTASVLASTPPFFVVIVNRVLFGQRVNLQVLLGLITGFVGVVLMASSQLGSGGAAGDVAVGMGFAIAAAIGWALGTLLVKELLTRHPDTDLVGLTTGQFLVGGIALLPLAFGIAGTGGTEWTSGELWLAVAFVSIVGSAIATVAYFGALRWISATSATTWLFLAPVVTVLLEIALGHVPKPPILAGMAITIVGVAIVNAATRSTPSTR